MRELLGLGGITVSNFKKGTEKGTEKRPEKGTEKKLMLLNRGPGLHGRLLRPAEGVQHRRIVRVSQGVPDRVAPQRRGRGRRAHVVRLQQAPGAHAPEPRAPGRRLERDLPDEEAAAAAEEERRRRPTLRGAGRAELSPPGRPRAPTARRGPADRRLRRAALRQDPARPLLRGPGRILVASRVSRMSLAFHTEQQGDPVGQRLVPTD